MDYVCINNCGFIVMHGELDDCTKECKERDDLFNGDNHPLYVFRVWPWNLIELLMPRISVNGQVFELGEFFSLFS